jgi:DNA polymerase III subunit delta
VSGGCVVGPWHDGRVSTLPPVQLVVGDEELLAARAVSDIVAVARAADADVEVRQYEAGTMVAGELAEMLSPSLFGGRRVLVVRAAQDAKKDVVAAILDYVRAPESDVTLVLQHAGGAKGKAFVDGLRAAKVHVVAVPKISRPRERVDFVVAEIRRLGGRANDTAAEALITAVGADLRELVSACSQLVADTGGQIDATTVARYYRGRAEVTGFTVADAAMVGDVPAAIEALRWALQVGVDPVPIADALADGVRTVARVASAGRGSPYQISGQLGMPAWKVERAQRQARGWTADALVEAMRAAADCNAAVKGGADNREYALERAVFAVAAARQGGGGR